MKNPNRFIFNFATINSLWVIIFLIWRLNDYYPISSKYEMAILALSVIMGLTVFLNPKIRLNLIILKWLSIGCFVSFTVIFAYADSVYFTDNLAATTTYTYYYSIYCFILSVGLSYLSMLSSLVETKDTDESTDKNPDDIAFEGGTKDDSFISKNR